MVLVIQSGNLGCNTDKLILSIRGPPLHRLLRIGRGGQWQAAVAKAGSNTEKVVPIFSEASTRFNRERAKTQSINLPYF